MNVYAKFVDSIRVKPDRDSVQHAAHPRCEWAGCDAIGEHRAPKGRGREGQYFRFCRTHAAAYNKSYNYFTGMDDDAVRAWQRDAVFGHRPTWPLGNRAASVGGDSAPDAHNRRAKTGPVEDPFGLFDDRPKGASESVAPRRRVMPLEKRSLDTLDLDESATGTEIRARYKELVKRHHPDANQGDRSSEARLRQVIQAYQVLRKAGRCKM